MFTARFQALYLLFTLTAFVVTARATRASARTVAGAIVAVLLFTVLSAPIDRFAGNRGWWWYPSGSPGLLTYFGQASLFVGCVSLIAARLRWRWRVFAIVCGVGAIRDFSVASVKPSLIAFGPLPASLLADMAAWAIVCACAIFVPLMLPRAPEGRERM